MANHKTLEICIDSFASAKAAIAGGADRLEVCSSLALGGLTPFLELVEEIRNCSDVKIRPMIRLRNGDFLYDKEELQIMKKQIQNLRKFSVDGFVFGCLQADGSIDEESMKVLMDAADGLPITLHRAIDVSRDILESYEVANRLGVDTILTSGGKSNCIAGLPVLKELLSKQLQQNSIKKQAQHNAIGQQARYSTKIMVGAGVTTENLAYLAKELPDVSAFHMSGKIMVEGGMQLRNEGVPMGLPGLDEWHIMQTDERSVRKAREILDYIGEN